MRASLPGLERGPEPSHFRRPSLPKRRGSRWLRTPTSDADGPEPAREFGQALPEPFYFLAIAVLFVVELFNSRRYGLYAIGRALALAAVFDGVFVFADEGGASVWNDPAVALGEFVGVTVLAVALVAAALRYLACLLVLESEWCSSG